MRTEAQICAELQEKLVDIDVHRFLRKFWEFEIF